GKSADNLLKIEQTIAAGKAAARPGGMTTTLASGERPHDILPPLDPIISRIEGVLKRKHQLILYGPPGTGKTYHTIRAARELAARQIFRKTFHALPAPERKEIEDRHVRLCTFHPGYGYEDFIEGLKPKTNDGHMVFERRDGIFKQLCQQAEQQQERCFYLLID